MARKKQKALVPRESKSKGIQRRHVRRIETRTGPKDILINPEVSRLPSLPAIRHRKKPSVIRPLSQSYGPGSSKARKAPVLTPKIRWQDVLKPDKGLPLEQKELQEGPMIPVLPDNAIVAEKVFRVTGHPMSVKKEIHFVDPDGAERIIAVEMRMSNASGCDWLFQQIEKGKPVVFYQDDMMPTMAAGWGPVPGSDEYREMEEANKEAHEAFLESLRKNPDQKIMVEEGIINGAEYLKRLDKERFGLDPSQLTMKDFYDPGRFVMTTDKKKADDIFADWTARYPMDYVSRRWDKGWKAYVVERR